MTIEDFFVPIVSAVSVCYFNQSYFQKEKEKRELERGVKKERFYKLYLPIRKLLYRRVDFEEGYIGLDDSDVQEIIGMFHIAEKPVINKFMILNQHQFYSPNFT